MSVVPIGSSSISTFQQSQSAQSNWQAITSSAASALGLSPSALQQQLQSGQSLSAIAQTQGVSQQSLVQSITSALTQNGSTASASQLQQIATSIANRTPGAGGHHHHHGGGGSPDTQQSVDPTLLAVLNGNSSASTTDPLTANSDVAQGFDTFA
jgi:hypothetical protein